MIAAQTFGTTPDHVRVEKPDSASAPFAGGAGSSQITYSVGPAVQAAVEDARRQLLEIGAQELEVDVDDLVVNAGEITVKGTRRSKSIGELVLLSQSIESKYRPIQGQGRVAVNQRAPVFVVHLARVNVDRETGAFRVVKFAVIQDVGRAINPAEILGQIQGGTLQGIGRAIGEETVHVNGHLRTASFADYQVPTIDLAPSIDVMLIEVPSAHGPFGAKHVGEASAIPGAAAVANAIYAAVGIRVTELPIGMDALLAKS